MRRGFILTIVFSIIIIGITTSIELVKVGLTEDTIKSLYKEDYAVLFFLDGDSSFYDSYSFNGASSYFILRKFGHFLTYGFVAGVVFLLLPIKRLWLKGISSFSLASFIGLTDEIHQHFLLNRSGRILDVYVNMAGSLMSVLMLMIICILLKWSKNIKAPSNFRRL